MKIERTCPRCRARYYHWFQCETWTAHCSACGYVWKVRIKAEEKDGVKRRSALSNNQKLS